MSAQWGCDSFFFLHFCISTFLYFYISIFLHFYIFTFLHIFLHLKPYCEEAEVPTGRFGFSFHHFVKWKRSCMHKLNCKTRRNTIPNCPIVLGGKDVDGGNGYQRDQGVWIKAGKSYCSLGRDWKTPISMTKDPNELESLMHVCWSGGQKGLCILSEEHKDSSQLIRSWTFNCSVCSAASVEKECSLEYIRIK